MKPNRKQLKKKERSCPMCKPHKTQGSNRWKAKQRAQDEEDKRQIEEILIGQNHNQLTEK